MKKIFNSKLKDMSSIYIVSGDINNVKITRSEDVNKLARKLFPFALSDRECMISLYLNNGNRTLGYGICSIGGYTATMVDVRIPLKEALLASATGLILIHNHPSGTLEPSQADISITKKVKNAANLIDINLLDHLVVTEESFYSFADEGKL